MCIPTLLMSELRRRKKKKKRSSSLPTLRMKRRGDRDALYAEYLQMNFRAQPSNGAFDFEVAAHNARIQREADDCKQQ